MLASTMGVNILIWAQKNVVEEQQEKLLSAMKNMGIDPEKTPGRRRSSGANMKKKEKKSPQTKQDKKTTEAKLKVKTQTKTKSSKK